MASNCDDLQELIAAYSIGATDPEETRRVEQALVECPELAEELAEYAGLHEALLYAVPQRYQAPPVSRLLAGLNQPANHVAEFEDDTLRVETLAVLPKPAPRKRGLWWLGVAALFVVTVLAVGSNLLWFYENAELRSQLSIQKTPAPTGFLPVVLKPEDSHHRRLSATTAGQPDAQAQVIWNSDIEVGALYATNLQQLSEDMAYQFWGVRGDVATSLGQFQVDENGTGFLIFQSPEPVASFDALGISPEPASGSAQPTHEHVVVGKV